DTRRLRRLAGDLGVVLTGRLLSYFEGNELARTPELLALLVGGSDVLLVSDAGMPSVSDPGYRLVRAAVDADVDVRCLPGPSAVTAALALSGLPADRFCFEGFLPRKAGPRRRALDQLAAERRTMVFFEAPHRIAAMLAAVAEVFGPDRPAAVCRELTKTFEEVRRGGLGELVEWAEAGLRGEITIVVQGCSRVGTAEPGEFAAEVAAREAAGQPRKEAIGEVARAHGVPKRTVFDAVVAYRL
ncbi:MAG: 16S rRNA (cytidine(1402)-2'-O)-methyltransferase, partial [Geodermatophilaceae bacterium]